MNDIKLASLSLIADTKRVMATYKVIQDIEAEDKLFGPLTLRQFIYAGIVVVTGYVAFRLAVSQWFLAIPLLPVILFFGLLAAPLGRDQPNEVWLLAKIRFYLKPQRRIWDQSGIKQLVTITVPKKIEKVLSKNFTQTEVKSRLQALANTIDTRGWAVKNINVNLTGPAGFGLDQESDRLLATTSLPQTVPAYDVAPADDILDPTSNPTAAHLDQMIQKSAEAHRQQALATMQSPAENPSPAANNWFSDPPAAASPVVPASNSTALRPAAAADDNSAEAQALLARLHAEKAKGNPTFGHMRTIRPIGDTSSPVPVTQPSPQPDDTPPPAIPQAVNPAILDLANNDDLNVATIARQAEKAQQNSSDDEVVVSLR